LSRAKIERIRNKKVNVSEHVQNKAKEKRLRHT